MPRWKGNPSDKPLTKQQESFVRLVAVEQLSQRVAYREAYPAAQKWSDHVVDVQAYKTMKKPNMMKKYNLLVKACREAAIKNASWSREEAMENAIFLLEAGRREAERIEQAFEQEIQDAHDELDRLITEGADAEDIRRQNKNIRSLQKSKRLGMTPVQAIQGAMETLNKLQGYNKETLNVTADVNFSGEDELED